jgi:hypothetical protein
MISIKPSATNSNRVHVICVEIRCIRAIGSRLAGRWNRANPTVRRYFLKTEQCWMICHQLRYKHQWGCHWLSRSAITIVDSAPSVETWTWHAAISKRSTEIIIMLRNDSFMVINKRSIEADLNIVSTSNRVWLWDLHLTRSATSQKRHVFQSWIAGRRTFVWASEARISCLTIGLISIIDALKKVSKETKCGDSRKWAGWRSEKLIQFAKKASPKISGPS